MTLWEFSHRVRAHDKREQADWHKIRVMASILLSPHLKRGKRLKPEDLIPLPDDIKQVRTMTAEQVQKDVDRKTKIMKKWLLRN